MWRHGGVVVAADECEVAKDDPVDPMRTAMRQMMGVVRSAGAVDDRREAAAWPGDEARRRRLLGRAATIRLPSRRRFARGGPEEQRAIKLTKRLKKRGLSFRSNTTSFAT